MFPSFTGSARPRRQVNLSGRNTNPFTSIPGSRQPSASQAAQNTLAHAQQERLLRQQERARPPAATKIQRVWRGSRDREGVKRRWRSEWDHKELLDQKKSADVGNTNLATSQIGLKEIPYESEGACLSQLRLLVQFASPKLREDILRLHLFAGRYLSSSHLLSSAYPADLWTHLLLRLAKITIAILNQQKSLSLSAITINRFLSLLSAVSAAIPKQVSSYARLYYRALAEVISSTDEKSLPQTFDQSLFENVTLSLIRPLTAMTITAYEGFVSELLITPDLSAVVGSLDRVGKEINYKILASAVNELLLSSESNLLQVKTQDELLWLLAYFVHFRRLAHSLCNTPNNFPDTQYVNAVSSLISHLADDIGMRIDVPNNSLSVNGDSSSLSTNLAAPLPSFVKKEILSLVNQESISGLLSHLEASSTSTNEASSTPNQASVLASFALTLLRCFPRRADEIRMWLYLGSTSRQSIETSDAEPKVPAIKYLYQAAHKTNVYALIRRDPGEVISMLKYDLAENQSGNIVSKIRSDSVNQQWRIILLLLELYTFILKVMDDEEFFFGSSLSNNAQSWTRQSALPLDFVKDLTLFLKNLAFSMYWNASELSGVEILETKNSIAEYFTGNTGAISESSQETSLPKTDEIKIAGITGMNLSYMKGMVTGLLRMVYEREWVKCRTISNSLANGF